MATFLENLRDRRRLRGHDTPFLDEWLGAGGVGGGFLTDQARGLLEDRRETGTSRFPVLSNNANALLAAGGALLSGGRNAWGNAANAFISGGEVDRQRAEQARLQQQQVDEQAGYEEMIGLLPQGQQALARTMLTSGNGEVVAQMALQTLAAGGAGGGYFDEIRGDVLGYTDPDGRWQPYPEWMQPSLGGDPPESMTLFNPEDGLFHRYGWNQATQDFDIDYGIAPQGSSTNLSVSPDGTVTFTQGAAGPGGEDVGAGQRQAATFGRRTFESNAILSELEGSGIRLSTYMLNNIGIVGNLFASPDQQRFAQAARDFINAVLRRESGAAISEGEFASARTQYLPQPGDSPEVLEQKRQNREVIIAGLFAEAGPTAREELQQMLDELRGGGGGGFNPAAPALPPLDALNPIWNY